MKKYIIGTSSFGYNQMRNFAGLPFNHFKVKKVYDFCKIASYINLKIFNNIHPFLSTFFIDCGIHKADIYHFFNGIALSGKPWIVSYETAVPRYNPLSEFGLRTLASDNCRKIIAISQRAIDIQRFFLAKTPKYENKILKKIIKLHPAQELYINSVNAKTYDQELIFTMVGSEFFKKGGVEVLAAFEKLIQEKYPVKLNIISLLRISPDDLFVGESDRKAALATMNRYPRSINYYPFLPNDKVIEIFKNSHIGLLPSHWETYGYSVLEAMACGCPVIVTNIPPFPEFVNEDVGWLIEVPQRPWGGSRLSDAQSSLGEYKEFSKKLTAGLYAAIKEIFSRTDSIRRKASAAIESIRRNHDPVDAAANLENIYRAALGV